MSCVRACLPPQVWRVACGTVSKDGWRRCRVERVVALLAGYEYPYVLCVFVRCVSVFLPSVSPSRCLPSRNTLLKVVVCSDCGLAKGIGVEVP